MHRFVVAGLVSAVVAAPCGAQPSQVVTEAEFLSALDASHPARIERGESLALARSRVLDLATLENPELSFGREDLGSFAEQTELRFSWQLPSSSRRFELEAGRETVQAEQARESQGLRSLRREMREVYAQWALTAAREERLTELAERVRQLADRDGRRAEAGETAGLTARRLALAAETLEAQAALASILRQQAYARARSWMPSLSSEARPRLPEPVVLAPPAGDALRIQAAAADLRAARFQEQAAGRYLLAPELSVGWQRQEAEAASRNGVVFGLTWSVPVFDRNQGKAAATGARVAGAQARLELARREVTAVRSAARLSLEQLSRSLAAAREALEGHRGVLDSVEAAFRLGEMPLTDLLDTQRSYTEAALSVLDLHAAALAAQRELELIDAPALVAENPSSHQPDESEVSP